MHIFYTRQGQTAEDYCYFYTQSIINFRNLLKDDDFKMIIIESLRTLVDRKLVTIYGFVIMPNHIHLIWRMNKINGKETPSGSFTKFTAHQFKKKLLESNPILLETYAVNKIDRSHQFWKWDPLAVALTSEKIFLQKLLYMHDNPLKENWKLCNLPEEYKWSSAKFYEKLIDEFDILQHFK